MKASTAARLHTAVWIRPTGTPKRLARSALSAAARAASPIWLRWRSRASRATTTGTAMSASTSLSKKLTPPSVKSRSKGGSMRGASTSSSNRRGSSDGDAGQHLGQADGGHREQQARGPAEAADHGDLDDGAERRRHDEPGRHGQEPAPAPGHHEEVHQHDGGQAEVALREGHDAVGPPREGHAEGDERGEPADDGALDPDAQRDGEERQLQRHDRAERQEAHHLRPHPFPAPQDHGLWHQHPPSLEPSAVARRANLGEPDAACACALTCSLSGQVTAWGATEPRQRTVTKSFTRPGVRSTVPVAQ